MSENWARDLLERAGETVPTTTPPNLDVSTRWPRWWPALVAAASVLLIVGLVLALHPGRPDLLPKHPAPPEGATVVPLVFGMQADLARTTLESAGLEVTVKDEQTCAETEGRVIGTEPGQGRPVADGRVTLLVSGPKDSICHNEPSRTIALQLIDLATGRGPGPAFAPGFRCCDSSLLQTLAAAATQYAPTPGPNLPPQLFVQDQMRRGGPDAFDMTVGIRFNGQVSATFDIVVEVGNSLSGHAGLVLGVRRGDPHVFRTHESSPGAESEERAADPDAVGRRFLDFALGRTDSPPIDTPVKLYLGNRYMKTLSPEQATDQAAWRVCASYGEGSCPFSAIETLARNGDHPLAWSNAPHQSDFCPDGLATGPPTDTGGSYAVVLSVPEPQSCAQAFEVQVWVNDAAQIVAVNLLLGSP